MSDEASFERDEIGKLEQIVAEYRAALAERIFGAFPEDKAAEAFYFALAMLFASRFADEVKQHHEMELRADQILARARETLRQERERTLETSTMFGWAI
jgi:hypothetical protein